MAVILVQDQAAEIQAMESFTLAVEALVKASLVWVQNLKVLVVMFWHPFASSFLSKGCQRGTLPNSARITCRQERLVDPISWNGPPLCKQGCVWETLTRLSSMLHLLWHLLAALPMYVQKVKYCAFACHSRRLLAAEQSV